MGAARAEDAELPYRSTGGRPLSSHGGVVPDVVLRPDTLSTEESLFAQSLDGQIGVFRDVLNAYALELRRGGSVKSKDFAVTPEMRAEVRSRLQDRGVDLPDSVFAGGDRLVASQLGYEVARYVFGPAAERERRIAEDSQVREAVTLLRGTTSTRALLGMAEARAARPH
jgi:hypothetical protein